MAKKIFSNDLPAAKAYHADQLASAGYDADARIIYGAPSVSEVVFDFIRETAQRLMAKINGLRTPAQNLDKPTVCCNAPKHQIGMKI